MEMNAQDKEWERAYTFWVNLGRIGRPPKKPKGFDLRCQGNDPMKLEGFGVKPPREWHSDATPPEWPSEKREQTNFDL